MHCSYLLSSKSQLDNVQYLKRTTWTSQTGLKARSNIKLIIKQRKNDFENSLDISKSLGFV